MSLEMPRLHVHVEPRVQVGTVAAIDHSRTFVRQHQLPVVLLACVPLSVPRCLLPWIPRRFLYPAPYGVPLVLLRGVHQHWVRCVDKHGCRGRGRENGPQGDEAHGKPVGVLVGLPDVPLHVERPLGSVVARLVGNR